MADENTTVDVLSLEDFHRTLAARLDEANAVLATMTSQLQGKPPALGGFQDATRTSGRYQTLHTEHVTRAQRLVDAVAAAQAATVAIIRNYRTTEARNEANAKDIARTMRSVDEVLDGRQADAR
jgi:ABC-type transporter Mla subunit MlaD